MRALAPGAQEAAAELDEALAQAVLNASLSGSEPRLPPLFCAPMLIKDNMDLEGLATTAGEPHKVDSLAWAGCFMRNGDMSWHIRVVLRCRLGGAGQHSPG